MNPDGYAKGRRSNGHNVDLNRDFPDQYDLPDFGIFVVFIIFCF